MTSTKGLIEKWKNRQIDRRLTLSQLKKDLRLTQIKIDKKQSVLRQRTGELNKLEASAQGKPDREIVGIAMEIVSLENDITKDEAALMDLFNKRTTLKQFESIRLMEIEATSKGTLSVFEENEDRIIEILEDENLKYNEKLLKWQTLANETGMLLDTILPANNPRVQDVVARLKIKQMEDDLDDLALHDDENLTNKSKTVRLTKKE